MCHLVHTSSGEMFSHSEQEVCLKSVHKERLLDVGCPPLRLHVKAMDYGDTAFAATLPFSQKWAVYFRLKDTCKHP